MKSSKRTIHGAALGQLNRSTLRAAFRSVLVIQLFILLEPTFLAASWINSISCLSPKRTSVRTYFSLRFLVESSIGSGTIAERSRMLNFSIPLIAPSVNHYVSHTTKADRRTGAAHTLHRKSPEAKAFERDFILVLPASARGSFVISQSKRFSVTLEIYPPKGGKGDVDNRNKVLLDSIAKAGMLRDTSKRVLSDAWIKRLTVEIRDSKADRSRGPLTIVSIEPL